MKKLLLGLGVLTGIAGTTIGSVALSRTMDKGQSISINDVSNALLHQRADIDKNIDEAIKAIEKEISNANGKELTIAEALDSLKKTVEALKGHEEGNKADIMYLLGGGK